VLSNRNLFKIKKDIRSSILPPRNTRRTLIQPSDKVSDINKDGRVDSLTILLTNATATTPKSTRIGNLGAEWLRGGDMCEANINRTNRPWSSTRHSRQLPWSAEGRPEKSLPGAGTQAGYCRRKKRRKILQIDIWPGRRDSHLHRRRRNQQIEAGS